MIIVKQARRTFSLALMLMASLVAAPESSGEVGETVLQPASWLTLGPQVFPRPALAVDVGLGAYGGEQLLKEDLQDLQGWMPESGNPAGGLKWVGADADAKAGPAPSSGELRVTYRATYVEASRFVSGQLKGTGEARFSLFLDGRSIAKKTSAGEGEGKGSFQLVPGKHLLLLKVVEEEGGAGWPEVSLSVPEALASAVSFDLSPIRALSLEDLLETESVRGADQSPRGEALALHLQRPGAGGKEKETWTEIRRLPGGEVLRTLRGASSFSWLPTEAQGGLFYSYVVDEGEGKSLWVAGLDGGAEEKIIKAQGGLDSYLWAPDGKSLIVALEAEAKKDDRGVKRYRGLNDRRSGWRDHSRLVQVFRPSRHRRPLTAGPKSVTLLDVSPEGDSLLFSVVRDDPSEEPLSFDELFELDLQSLEARSLGRIPWFNNAVYGPRGEALFIKGGPSSFGTAGKATAEGVPSNNYDGQLYRMDRSSGEVQSLSRDFDPAVEDFIVLASGDLVARAQVGSRLQLYRFRSGEGFELLPTPEIDAVTGFTLGRESSHAVVWGSGLEEPGQVRLRPLDPAALGKEIYRPAAESLSRARWGEIEDFEFAGQKGPVRGRLHRPLNYDAAKKYPLIVYYYGGTVPSDREFGGRYPAHLWSALGYFVYVPQPSGATGWGQEFSGRHVNDWGQTTADEIIEGTRQVLKTNKAIDASQVGCIGASYGGFMTMTLLTRTDLFAAAVAHAGISSISSYWGEGWWAYLYSAVASAGSYPWNSQDLYVDHSPLFHTDAITTPLLLLHGTADTNVPIGESQQLYTALKVLAKDVEFLTFEGENHRIVDPEKRKIWSESIVAWFEARLKGQPEWWQFLYGTESEPKG